MKFQIQLALVEKALAGARIRKGTISAGYSLAIKSDILPRQILLVSYHVMPSHPIAKKVLNMKRKSAATIPGPFPPR